MEARLIKDIQPKYNRDLKDDKTFPYLADHDRRGLPPRQLHPRAARPRRQAVWPVPAGQEPPRRHPGARSGSSSSAPARWTSRKTTRAGGGSDPACCTRSTSAPPRATCGSTARPTATDIRRLQLFLDGKKDVPAQGDGGGDAGGQQGAPVREGGPAPRRDQGAQDARTSAATSPSTPSPRSSTSTRARGSRGSRRCSKLDSIPRTIDGVDIAHLGGTEMVGSLVTLHRRPAVQAGLSPLQDQERAGHRRLRLDPRGGHAADQGPAGARRAVPRHLADRRRQGAAQRRPGRLRCAQGRPADRDRAGQAGGGDLPRPADPTRSCSRRRSFALRLLQYVRDEAHRFAQHYHHMLRKKRTLGEDE